MSGTVSPDDKAFAKALLELFDAKGPDGEYVYQKDEVRALLPLLILGGEPVPLAELPAPLQKLMIDFVEAAEITKPDDANHVQKQLRRHYRANPLNPSLLAGYQRLVRELKASGASARSFAKLIGGEERKTLEAPGPAPEGSIPSGPMARFLLR